MTAFFMLLVGLAIGVPAGAYLLFRKLSPKMELLKQQLQAQLAAKQDVETKWLELISMLDENNQLPKDAAAQLRQFVEPPAKSQLVKRSGKSADRRLSELARIKAGQPSLDSLEEMRSEDVRLVLIARIKAKRPLLHSLKGLKSEDRRLVEVACAKHGVVL